MKLKDILEKLDRSKKPVYFPTEKLFMELGFDGMGWDVELEKHGFEEYPVANWYCTDTWVGMYALYHNDEPFAITWQIGRKADVEFMWIGGIEKYNTIRSICANLIPPSESNIKEISLDEEMGDGIKVEFSGQLLNKTVVLEETKEVVEVIKKFHDYSDIEKWREVGIRTANGEEKFVSMKDVTVPFNLVSK